MQFKDYYKTIGVEADARPERIKQAYRRLARKYHPDVSKEADAEARFKEVQEAYEVLKDPDKRAEYDQLRRYANDGGGSFRAPPGWHPRSRGGAEAFGTSGFSEFFEQFFGRGAAEPFAHGMRLRGEDVASRLAVSLEEAYHGGERQLRIAHPGGARTVRVQIPKGVMAGQQIRLAGQGGPGSGGAPSGDLYLEIEFEPHPLYSADQRDITLVLPIAPWEAGLGGEVTVPTLGGSVKLKVPANAQSGQRLRLRGRGLPGDPPGDQFVVLQVRMPPIESAEAREALQALEKAAPFDPRARLGQAR